MRTALASWLRTAPGHWRPLFRWWRCPKGCGRSWPAAARGCRPRRIGWRSAHRDSPGRSCSRLPRRPPASTTAPRCPRLDELLAAAMIRPGEPRSATSSGTPSSARRSMTPSTRPGRPGSTGGWPTASRRPGRGFPDARIRPRSSPSTRAAPALPGAEAGIPAAIAAADLAQAAGAHEAAVAFLATAADLAGPDDERLITIQARLGLALAWALRFDEAVTAARDAAERVADTEGALAAADYLAEVTSALSAAGSSAHAWHARARRAWRTPVPRETRRGRRSPCWPWTARRRPTRSMSACPCTSPGGGRRWPSCTGRPGWSRAAWTSPGTRSRPSTAGGRTCPPRRPRTRRCCCICSASCGPALPVFEEAAARARARGELAREVHCRASIARALAALGDLAGARAALAEARELASRIPGRAGAGNGSTSWVRGMRWRWRPVRTGKGIQAAFDELVGTDDPVVRWARAPMCAGYARTAAHLGHGERAMAMLALPVQALGRAPGWALNYTRTASDTAEALWLLGRRDHLRPSRRPCASRRSPPTSGSR